MVQTVEMQKTTNRTDQAGEDRAATTVMVLTAGRGSYHGQPMVVAGLFALHFSATASRYIILDHDTCHGLHAFGSFWASFASFVDPQCLKIIFYSHVLLLQCRIQ